MSGVVAAKAAGEARQGPPPLGAPPGPPPATPQVSRRVNVIRLALVAAVWALPLLRPAGPGNTGPVDAVVAVAILGAALWFSGHGHRIRLPYAVPVGMSVLAGSLAAVVAYSGAYVSVGGSLLSLIQDVFLFLWAVAIANVSREPALLRAVTRAWAISATFWAAVLIIGVLGHISALSGITPRTGVRASLTLGDPNLAANYFVCSLLMLRAVRYPRRRALRWTCCALILTAIVFTGSNGGVLALVVATLLGCVFTLARRRGLAPAVLLLSAVTVIALAAVPYVHKQTLVAKAQTSVPLLRDSIGRQAESSGSRSTILAQTVKLYFNDDTPFGLGPGGVKGALKARQFSYVKMAHDDYAAALVERGVLGAIALVFLLVIVAARCRRIATRPLRPRYADIIPRPELLGAAVAAMFLSAFFYQVLHFRHVWLLFGLVAALDLWGRQDRDAETLDSPGTPALKPAFQGRAFRHQPPGARSASGASSASSSPSANGAPSAAPKRWFRFWALAPVLTANVAARVIALAALAVATILVARAGGPKLLGELTLLRVLPGLAGVLVCCGLPSAVPYFLAARDRHGGPRLRTTLVALTLVGSLTASACWLMLSPVLHQMFFRLWGIGVVLAAAVPVFTQLWVAVGKSFLQGENDMRGANVAIAAEEAAFLPVYLALMPFMHGTALLMSALVGADILVVAGIVVRLWRKGFLGDWGRPQLRLAVTVCRYGLRGQVGGIFTLLNLRLDVVILGALAGPGVLGVYAVASKFAELLRLPGLAVTYVLYPRLAMCEPAEAGRRAAALMPRAFALTALAALPLAAAVPLLPLIYGHAFVTAVIPAYILLAGLVGEGVAGVASAYLYGVGRPGTNSLGVGVAVVLTVVLDVALIPHYHAIGAATASAAAYLTSSAALLACYFVVRKSFRTAAREPSMAGAS